MIALIVLYVVCAIAVFVGLIKSFLERNPDGAVSLDEGKLITLVTCMVVASVAWPLMFVGLLVGVYLGKVQIYSRKVGD